MSASAEDLNPYCALAPGVRCKKKEILLVRKSWQGSDVEALGYICMYVFIYIYIYGYIIYETATDAFI